MIYYNIYKIIYKHRGEFVFPIPKSKDLISHFNLQIKEYIMYSRFYLLY